MITITTQFLFILIAESFIIFFLFFRLLTPYRLFISFGTSMGHYLSIGYGKKFDYVSVNDIVCFERPKNQTLLMHRITNISNNGLITIQGDNKPNEIDEVLLNQIIFKVVREISI